MGDCSNGSPRAAGHATPRPVSARVRCVSAKQRSQASSSEAACWPGSGMAPSRIYPLPSGAGVVACAARPCGCARAAEERAVHRCATWMLRMRHREEAPSSRAPPAPLCRPTQINCEGPGMCKHGTHIPRSLLDHPGRSKSPFPNEAVGRPGPPFQKQVGSTIFS